MTTRVCKKCSETKAIEEFQFYDPARTKRRHACRTCNSARVEAHHVTNKERRLSRIRERYAEAPWKVWTPERRRRANELSISRYAVLREEVFDKLGGECQACGENERLFLTIDHINNDGQQLRLENRHREIGYGLYVRILRYGMPDHLEVLCFNCNFGKRRNGGVLVKDRRRRGKSND